METSVSVNLVPTDLFCGCACTLDASFFLLYSLGPCGSVWQRNQDAYLHLCETHECGSRGFGQISHHLYVAGEKREIKVFVKPRFKMQLVTYAIFILAQLSLNFMQLSLSPPSKKVKKLLYFIGQVLYLSSLHTFYNQSWNKKYVYDKCKIIGLQLTINRLHPKVEALQITIFIIVHRVQCSMKSWRLPKLPAAASAAAPPTGLAAVCPEAKHNASLICLWFASCKEKGRATRQKWQWPHQYRYDPCCISGTTNLWKAV